MVALDAVGALLVTVVLIVPAATVRLFEPALRAQQVATFALAAVEGLLAIWIADGFNIGPGPALAVLGAALYAVAALYTQRRTPCGWCARERHHARPARRLRARHRRAGRGRVHGRRGRDRRGAGPNGGGKTTLFRALLGELPYRTGTVELAGRPAYVPQTEGARLDFPVSAHDVALMGAYGRTPWFKRVAREDRAKADAALARVGLADQAGARFGTLSGGQRQRVLIARALVQDAPLLLLDEPLSGVDRPSAVQIERVFAELQAEGRALLVATHDVAQANAWPRVLCLNHGQVAFGAPATTLTTDVLRRTYGDELVILDGTQQAVCVSHHDHAH